MKSYKLAPLAIAVSIGLGLSGCNDDSSTSTKTIQKVEFVGFDAPKTDDEIASTYTKAKAKITYTNNTSEEKSLVYNTLFYNTDKVGSSTYAAAQLYDQEGNPLRDAQGNLVVAETPDANSLMQVDGKLFLVTHYEYDWLDSAKNDMYARMPMSMSLTTLEQDKTSGKLTATQLKPISFKSVSGLWIPCAGSLSPWNTHLGSEEYEPDARCQTESTYSSACNTTTNATNSLEAMIKYGISNPNPYNYGLTPEITVKSDGSYSVVKHRVLGRLSRELAQVMPDNRTVYQGDDGTYNVLTMFVADKEKDLSSGTLYAAKWTQTSDKNGGEATLTWIKLGSSNDTELTTLANSSKFSDIFETAPVVKNSDGSYQAAPAGFKQIIAGHVTGNVENLKLKTGMEKAAAFLETRRYAAYLGATTEFEKFEGTTVNIADKKVYIAITRISNGMENKSTDPANEIRLSKLSAGGIYEISLMNAQKDSSRVAINSEYVGTTMKATLLGEDIAKDSIGNTCNVDKICNPDNIKFSEKLRTLFIGEDSSTAHINNFLWAYNVDTKQLTRLLSLTAGAESTGLQIIENINGFAYLMSNAQHLGDFSSNINADLKARISSKIDNTKAPIGYLSGIPAL
jgi:secreted PhoX family phosphatase